MKDENRYQKALSQKKAPINKEELWNKISNDQRFPKEKSTWYRKLIIGLPLLFIGLGICCFFLQSPEFIESNEHVVRENQIYKPHSTAKKPTTLTKVSPNQSDQAKQINIEKNQVQSNTNASNQEVEDLDSNPNKSRKSEDFKTKQSIASKTSNERPQSTSISEEGHISILEIKKNVNRTTSPINLADKTDHNSKKNILGNPFVSQQNKASNSTNNGPIDPEKRDSNIGLQDHTAQNTSALSLTPSKTLGIMHQYLHPEDPKLNVLLGNLKTLKDERSNHKWAVILTTGIGYSIHRISPLLPDTISGIDADNLLENTTNLETQLISLALRRTLNHHFNIQIEANYRNAFQKYQFQSENVDFIKNDDPDGGFYKAQSTMTEYKLFHSYKLININLLIGKEFPIGQCNIGLSTGISYNLLSSIQGNILMGEEDLFDLSTLDIYRNRASISYLANVELSYSLSNNMAFSLGLRYQSPSRLTNDNRVLDHQLSTISSNLGFIYSF